MIVFVTGEIGCGKTTACGTAIELLRARGVAVSGILSPNRLDASGAKTGIDVLDVATGERRRLAELVPGGGETTGDYTFDKASLDWASGRLLAAVTDLGRVGEINVLVVDRQSQDPSQFATQVLDAVCLRVGHVQRDRCVQPQGPPHDRDQIGDVDGTGARVAVTEKGDRLPVADARRQSGKQEILWLAWAVGSP